MFQQQNFISLEEQATLLAWANENRDSLMPNLLGPGRFSGQLSTLTAIPVDIEAKIRELSPELAAAELETKIGAYLSFNEDGGEINMHTDPTTSGMTHMRYNVMIQAAEAGGNLIYGDETFTLSDREVYGIDASGVMHGTNAVVGTKARIVVSYGFLITD